MIYFIQDGADGPIKIGFTTNIAKRLQSLQTGAARPLRLIATMHGSRLNEEHLHLRFAVLRRQGEWFDSTPVLWQFLVENARLQPGVVPVLVAPSTKTAWHQRVRARWARARIVAQMNRGSVAFVRSGMSVRVMLIHLWITNLWLFIEFNLPSYVYASPLLPQARLLLWGFGFYGLLMVLGIVNRLKDRGVA